MGDTYKKLIMSLPAPAQAHAHADGQRTATLPDRRSGIRTITVYRVVRVMTADDEGLARCRDLSDTGLRLDLTMPVSVGERIQIAFSSSVTLDGEIMWAADKRCGVRFPTPIDSAELLAGTSSETRAARSRPPRLTARVPARLYLESEWRTVMVEDISQKGMKLVSEQLVRPGLSVKIVMADDIERDGVIRWTKQEASGLMLLQPFSVEELGSIRSLAG